MAAIPNDVTTFSAALKEYYSGQSVETLTYKNNPFFALVDKKEDFFGKNYPVPVVYANGQGRSATFATALANQTADKVVAFAMTRKKDYALVTIDREVMISSKGSAAAFLESTKVAFEGAVRNLSNSIASALFRSGTGTIGYGTESSGVITLTNAADVVNFEVGQCIVPSATDGGAIISSAGTGYVIAVDRAGGTVTVASSGQGGTAAEPSNWTGTMYFTVSGDLNSKMSGLNAWIPSANPTSTTFYGVDRSVDVVRLGGVRYDGSAQSIEEAIIDASSLCAREGGIPDHLFVTYATYAALAKALGTRVQYVDLKAKADLGFPGFLVHGAAGPIKVTADRNCQSKVGWLLSMDNWTLMSAGKAPQLVSDDGLNFLRLSSSDAYESRWAFYGNLACNAPGWSARIALGI